MEFGIVVQLDSETCDGFISVIPAPIPFFNGRNAGISAVRPPRDSGGPGFRRKRESLGSVVKLHVIPAKAGIQGVFVSKSFCGIERFWIPAFAGMTEIKLSHVSESNLTGIPNQLS